MVEEANPETIYVLDLGISERTLDVASRMAEHGYLVLIDHHSNLDDVDLNAYQRADMRVIWDEDNCTSGLAFTAFKKQLSEEALNWAEIWAILGIYGDVADESPGGKTVLSYLLKRHPEMDAKQVFWSGKRREEVLYSLPSMLARYWNTARRIAYEAGAYVGFKACEEIERHGNVMTLLEDMDGITMAFMPHVALLRFWQNMYMERRNEVFSNLTYVDYGDYTVAVIDHPWDIGGYVASVKAEEKPCIVINTRLRKLTARGEGKIHLGAFMKASFGGGGHVNAGAAEYPEGMTLERILAVLQRTWRDMVEQTG